MSLQSLKSLSATPLCNEQLFKLSRDQEYAVLASLSFIVVRERSGLMRTARGVLQSVTEASRAAPEISLIALGVAPSTY